MAILVLQHDDKNRPGRLGHTLRDHAFKLDVRRLDKGDPLPPDLDDIDAVISLGGHQFVNEGHAWIQKEQALLRAAHERALPVVGICLGAQMITAALGGTVERMDTPEIGFVDVEILPAGHTDTILAGIAWNAPQFQKHHDTIAEPPAGATVLARSPACAVQAYRVGMRTYAFGYHFECDRTMIEALTADARTELHAVGLTTEEFARQLDASYERYARLGDRLCLNIATYLIPRVATAMRV